MRKVIRVLGDFRIRYMPGATKLDLGIVMDIGGSPKYRSLTTGEARKLAKWLTKWADIVDEGVESEG